ncbi:glycosyltransferase family 2 protein [Flavobacterium acetivorans]|uniref:glycosyltransferase family 2 protein n=1 Tax=Flavobacterium acetivorans TaxID=2893883 RepID=UPI001E30C338|nr:glycosyltransferase family 2 protein [Flavobacterium sp. F-29]UFH35699.1 glycosyltransferase [Flavobacterium sp. F-29]
MQFTLIICTYMRPKPLLQLLQSVQQQSWYPNEILVIDGSTNSATALVLEEQAFENLTYFRVPKEHRGLTRQRNYGIERLGENIEVVCFLDDDTELLPNYFEELIKTFKQNDLVSGVGGVAINENRWKPIEAHRKYNKHKYFQFEGFAYKEGQRNVLRNYLGLQSNVLPGKMPDYSHGRSCGFPLTAKIYEVDLLVGMSFAFRKKVFDSIRFSAYFEGYGLYEDADFSVRALEFGINVINTKVQLNHFHDESGRPDPYRYGKMVVRNGWYVWRVKNPNPKWKDQFKWHAITILLILVRFSNIVSTDKKKEAWSEALGRTVGWWSLFINKPQHTN